MWESYLAHGASFIISLDEDQQRRGFGREWSTRRHRSIWRTCSRWVFARWNWFAAAGDGLRSK